MDYGLLLLGVLNVKILTFGHLVLEGRWANARN